LRADAEVLLQLARLREVHDVRLQERFGVQTISDCAGAVRQLASRALHTHRTGSLVSVQQACFHADAAPACCAAV
jgi:hypothetical protein